MKLLALTLTVLFSVYSVQSQDTASIKLIEGIIKSLQGTAHVFYFDSIATTYRIDAIKTALTKRTITSIKKDSTQNNSITLTKAEQKYIFNKLDEMHKMVWEKNVFANSTRVQPDSSSFYFSEFAQANRKGWNPKSGRQIWEITKPIYLRDNSYCLLFTLYYCGSLCGRDELCFYKNINGNWRKWIVVTSGVF